MDKRILVSCPIQNRSFILSYYLESIYNLQYNKKLIDIYWIINNSTDNSLEILKEFKEKYKNEYNSIYIEIYNDKKYPQDNRSTQVREKTYHFLSELRNKMLKKCVKLNCDYLFSSDCDILLQEDTLNRLLAHDLPIVSNLLYNGYLYTPPDSTPDYDPIIFAYKFPNILKESTPRQYQHIVNYKVKNPHTNPIGTLIECDFTGASLIMSQEVCKNTIYAWHIQGEDESWSYSARQAGFHLFCDISLFQFHIMSPTLLEKYLNGELNNIIKI